jgi:peptide chain release factor 2
LEEYKEFNRRLEELKERILLEEDYDKNFAIISIKASAGGKDAMGCATLIGRMYLRWLNKKSYKHSVLSANTDAHDGIKEMSILAEFDNAYGRLKCEHGIHKVIRQSPFSANAKRQTSFVYVEMHPHIVHKLEKINIPPSDLKIEVFRASGPGGQSVNTTDSAVRVIHIPTSTTVVCQNERSQLQNKLMALEILQSRLLVTKRKEEKDKSEKSKQQLRNLSWGHHIRTYIFYPYRSIKSNRSQWKSSKLDSIVEDGEIDDMLADAIKSYNSERLQRYSTL